MLIPTPRAGYSRNKHHEEPPAVVGGIYRATVNGGASTACYEIPVTVVDLDCLRGVAA